MGLLSSGQQSILADKKTLDGEIATRADVTKCLSAIRRKYFEVVHHVEILLQSGEAASIDNNLQGLRKLLIAETAVKSDEEQVLSSLKSEDVLEG